MARTFNDEILASVPRYTLRNDAGSILNDNIDIELKTPAIQQGTPLNKAFFDGLFTYEEMQVEKKDASVQEEIKKPMFFELSAVTSGDKILDFSATSGLYDGNLTETLFPTMTLKTSRSGGWVLSSSPSGEETGIYASVDGDTSLKIDSINAVLKQTTLNSDRTLRIKNTSSSYNSTKTFVFDFKKSKAVVFNFYSQGTARSYTFSGSDDNSTWETISSFKGGSAVNVASAKAYRYYQLVTGAYYTETINYMYFSEVPDVQLKEYYENAFTSVSSLDKEKELIVKVPTNVDNTNIIRNTLNGIEIDKILTPGERTRLLYTGDKIMQLSETKLVSGSFTTATTSEFDYIDLGFKPDLVICYNSTNNGYMIASGSTAEAVGYDAVPKIFTGANKNADGGIAGNGFEIKAWKNGQVINYIAIRF